MSKTQSPITQSPITQNVKTCYVENNQPDKQYDNYIMDLGLCLERNNYQSNYDNNASKILI